MKKITFISLFLFFAISTAFCSAYQVNNLACFNYFEIGNYSRGLAESMKLQTESPKNADGYVCSTLYYYAYKKDYSLAIKEGEQALSVLINNENDYTPGLEFIYYYLYKSYYRLNNIKKAILYAEKAYYWLEKKEGAKSDILAVLFDLASFYRREMNFEKSIEYSFNALPYAKFHKTKSDNEIKSLLYSNIGVDFIKLEKYNDALYFCLKSLEYNDPNKNFPDIEFTMLQVGYIYAMLKKFDKGYKYLQEGIELAKKNKNIKAVGLGYLYLGGYYFIEKRFESANEVLDTSIEYYKQINDNEQIKEAERLKDLIKETKSKIEGKKALTEELKKEIK